LGSVLRRPISRVMPGLTAGALALLSGACSTDAPLGPEAPPPSSVGVPVALVRVSPGHQVGEVGSSHPTPLLVRVVDANGFGVPGVTVRWEVVTGTGAVCLDTPDDCRVGAWPLATGSDGTSRVWHRPLVLGLGLITAQVDGLIGSPLNFTVEGTGILIRFGPWFDCTGPDDPVGFRGPQGLNLVSVRVGRPVTFEYVEWVHSSCVARIVSTDQPAGGAPFDSGPLSPGMRFQFTPMVPGVWRFADTYSGGSDSLVVEPAPGSAGWAP
jgi:hypothetical protein